MSLDSKGPMARNVERRAACDVTNLEVAADLPNLPLKGIYPQLPMAALVGGNNQELLFCSRCGHTQLRKVLDGSVLYGESYSFRTSHSSTAHQGTDLSLSTLDQVAPGRQFRCSIDLGCNDLHLLKKLSGHAESRTVNDS